MESQWSVFYPEKYANPETDSDDTLYTRIKRVCTRYSGRTAIEYGSRKISYSSLLTRIDEVAVSWSRIGVEKGDVVMLMMGHNPMNVISVYALDKIGATTALAVPNLPTEFFEQFANAVGAKYCVMSCNQYLNYSHYLKNTKISTVIIGEYRYAVSGRDHFSFPFYPLSGYDNPKPRSVPEGIRLLYWNDILSHSADSNDVLKTGSEKDNTRTAIYLFPSAAEPGKTAARLTARSINISANILRMVFRANEDLTGKPARMLCLNESCFSFGFVAGIHSVLCSGQTVLLFTWYDTAKIFFAIKRYRPDVLIGYNSTVASINKAGPRTDILKSVDRIIVGGGLLTSSQKAILFEISQNSGRKLSVCSITGCDELLAFAYGPSDLDSDRLLGFPLPGVSMRVVDSATGLDVPEGVEGEIAVCSPVASGFDPTDDPAFSSKYRKLPDGRKWFFTGMIGKLNGNKMFYLVGNKSREARINSYPVYPDMVDGAVQMTEGVVESCSVVIERPEGPVLVSAVVPEEEFFYDNSRMEDLRDRIKSECGSMLHEAMRPSEIIFFVSLPKDSKGTCDFEAVKERIQLVEDEDWTDDIMSESESEPEE